MAEEDPRREIAASTWTARDAALVLARAAGHAACYGAAVWLIESAKSTSNFDMIGPPAMVFAFLVWLLIIGRREPSLLRLAVTGYATVAPAALMVLFAFGASAETTLRLTILLLPLVVLATGTVAATITVLYGMGLRLLTRIAQRAN